MRRPHARFGALPALSVRASGRMQVGPCEAAGTLAHNSDGSYSSSDLRYGGRT